jgi:hypothetical protein
VNLRLNRDANDEVEGCEGKKVSSQRRSSSAQRHPLNVQDLLMAISSFDPFDFSR